MLGSSLCILGSCKPIQSLGAQAWSHTPRPRPSRGRFPLSVSVTRRGFSSPQVQRRMYEATSRRLKGRQTRYRYQGSPVWVRAAVLQGPCSAALPAYSAARVAPYCVLSQALRCFNCIPASHPNTRLPLERQRTGLGSVCLGRTGGLCGTCRTSTCHIHIPTSPVVEKSTLPCPCYFTPTSPTCFLLTTKGKWPLSKLPRYYFRRWKSTCQLQPLLQIGPANKLYRILDSLQGCSLLRSRTARPLPFSGSRRSLQVSASAAKAPMPQWTKDTETVRDVFSFAGPAPEVRGESWGASSCGGTAPQLGPCFLSRTNKP